MPKCPEAQWRANLVPRDPITQTSYRSELIKLKLLIEHCLSTVSLFHGYQWRGDVSAGGLKTLHCLRMLSYLIVVSIARRLAMDLRSLNFFLLLVMLLERVIRWPRILAYCFILGPRMKVARGIIQLSHCQKEISKFDTHLEPIKVICWHIIALLTPLTLRNIVKRPCSPRRNELCIYLMVQSTTHEEGIFTNA